MYLSLLHSISKSIFMFFFKCIYFAHYVIHKSFGPQTMQNENEKNGHLRTPAARYSMWERSSEGDRTRKDRFTIIQSNSNRSSGFSGGSFSLW